MSINDPTGRGAIDGANPLSSILGSILGESPEAQKTRLEEAAKGANDLTNLVRRKKTANDDTGLETNEIKEIPVVISAKRKLETVEESEDASRGKKAKSEDVRGS